MFNVHLLILSCCANDVNKFCLNQDTFLVLLTRRNITLMYVLCPSTNKLTDKQTKRIVILSVLKQNHHYFEKIVKMSFLLESKYENVTGLAGLAGVWKTGAQRHKYTHRQSTPESQTW